MPAGVGPREERFGDRIKRGWRGTERFGPFVLVGLAFVLQTIGFALDQPTATAIAGILLSLGLVLIFALVFEIHSQLFRPEKERSYLEFDTLLPEIREHLELAARSQNKVEVKLIGLTLRNQWRIIEDFLRKLALSSIDVRVDVHIVHLDPDWDDLEKLNPRMPSMAHAFTRSIEDFSDDFSESFAPDGKWNLTLHGIREFPVVAGILIDRSKLFRTLCDADHGKITQGQRMYEFFEFRDPGKKFDQDSVDHFERIFEYYVTRTSSVSLGAGRRSSAELAQSGPSLAEP